MRSGGRTETPGLSGLIDVSLIGAGGFADVYRARQAHLGRWVAFKVFREPLHDSAVTNQFRAECQAVSRLDDQLNVIRVYDAGLLSDGRPYLVTELCDGSLQQLVVRRGGALREREAAELGYRVSIALVAAHSAQVIHGDVTPQNVLIRASGVPVLADFGQAVLRDYRGNTATGFNPAYAAPETLSHDGRIDERTDVYGLGATLYAMLTGRAPFAMRWAESDAERNRRVVAEPVSWPPGVAVSAGIHGLVSAMLAKSPAERPQLNAVADALALLRDEPTQPHAPPVAGPGTSGEQPGTVPDASPVAAPPPVAAADGSDEVTQRREPRRPPAAGRPRRVSWRVAIGSAVVILGVGVGFLVPAAGGPETPDAPSPIRTLESPVISLAPPDPLSALATRLSWSGAAGFTYTLVVTRQGVEPRRESVGESTTATIATEPTAAYCFQVLGTDGQQVVQSNAQPLRGTGC